MAHPKNKCAVTHFPAGHPDACNDCDPCCFGKAVNLWCRTCGGDTYIMDRACYGCDGTGFEPDRAASPPQAPEKEER